MASEAPALLHQHAATRGADVRRYKQRRPEASVLYKTVQAELETSLARANARERPVPRFVEPELRAFLRCGIPGSAAKTGVGRPAPARLRPLNQLHLAPGR
jgi:hypothetical protein